MRASGPRNIARLNVTWMILDERIYRLLILSDELHFGRAAQRLHLSQPALSGSLKSLESELRARLFRRTSRNVELTDAGNILVSEARRLLKESERTLALVRECESDLVGPVRAGYCSAMNLGWLGCLISNARKHGFLETDLQFIPCDATHLKEGLENRTLHAAFFVGNPARSDQSTFQYVTLFRENVRAVVPADHRLARTGVISIGELQDEPLVWLRREVDPLLHSTFENFCGSQGYRPKVVQETGTFYECLHFTRERIGITFLPSYMAASAGEGVVFVALAHAFHLEYTLAYRRHFLSSDQMERFARFVRDYVAQNKSKDFGRIVPSRERQGAGR